MNIWIWVKTLRVCGLWVLTHCISHTAELSEKEALSLALSSSRCEVKSLVSETLEGRDGRRAVRVRQEGAAWGVTLEVSARARIWEF